MTHEMKLQAVYFDLIKNGQKVYEIRLNDEKRKMIKICDIIVFKKEPELSLTINTVVKDLVYFKNFEEMIDALPAEKIGFKDFSREEIVRIYHEFYSKENEKKFGVVAIKIEVLK